MDCHDSEQAWKAMTVIEAQECLIGIDVVSFPHKTDEARDKSHRKYFEMAWPKLFAEPKAITIQDMSRLING